MAPSLGCRGVRVVVLLRRDTREIAGLGGIATRAGVGGGGYNGAFGAASYVAVPGSSLGRIRSVRAMLADKLPARLTGRDGMKGTTPPGARLWRVDCAGLAPMPNPGRGLRERGGSPSPGNRGFGLPAREMGGTTGGMMGRGEMARGESMKAGCEGVGLVARLGPTSPNPTVDVGDARDAASKARGPGVTGAG